jgi:hypothetical protein
MSFPQPYLPAKAPEFYDELAKVYLPHKIQDRLGYERALEVIDWLATQARSKDQLMFLRIVRELVEDYELELGEPRWCGIPGPYVKEALRSVKGADPSR